MKRTYDLESLLWRRMNDYGYRSIRGLAADAGIHCMALWNIINKHTMIPKCQTCAALCRTLDIDPDVLHQAMTNGWTPGAEGEHGEPNQTRGGEKGVCQAV